MTTVSKYKTLRLILGDQLNPDHSWYQQTDADTLYLIAELKQETDYAQHHIQKVVAFFLAMANFAAALNQQGHHVLHLTLDDTTEHADLPSLLYSLCQQYQIEQFEFQRPDEYRLFEQLRTLKLPASTKLREVDTEHFILPFDEISEAFPLKKHILMEHFYRRMRKRCNIMMTEQGKPEGGEWNYDKQNRQTLKTKDFEAIPEPLLFENPTSEIVHRLEKHHVKTIGKIGNTLLWPTSSEQANELLEYFCNHCLINFGRFQDAMTDNSPYHWSLYHSRLSFALNSKMLSPLDVINRAIDAYRANPDINIAQVEGFVRQILGWREYIRGIYWGNMPHYKELNHLSAERDLPEFFWNGETKMACMRSAINQSLDYAYAHHIQRLMVTGNFCLLTGISPDQVDSWYLGIYIDAIEWVEMPNTRGMALFADNGIIASKPYAASGNYINKMSDHCKGCHYKVKEKIGDNACPLNSLYWRFLDTHQDWLARNPRAGMIYRSWDNQTEEQRQAVLAQAEYYLQHIEQL